MDEAGHRDEEPHAESAAVVSARVDDYYVPSMHKIRGRAARKVVPRSSHGAWAPAENRPDPLDILEEQGTTRVSELLPIRYGRMLESPFTFYRGGAAIMAADLAVMPHSGMEVQLCGDAHLSNFGVFASPERKMMFDINDFDETLPGPWEWDVKRLAASFEVSGRQRGFPATDRRNIVLAGVRAYRTTMRKSATMSSLDVWYAHIDASQLMERIENAVNEKRLGKGEAKKAARHIAKARTRDSMRAFTKLADNVDGELRIVADPPLIVPIEDLLLPGRDRQDTEQAMVDLLAGYRQTLADEHHPLERYRYVHSARKVVGVGSVGTRAWVLLLLGKDSHDPLILQAKEAQASVAERYVGSSQYEHAGQRVVVGQRLMQGATDIFLGWQRVQELDGQFRDYYVRQLHDWKGSADVDTIEVPGSTLYAKLCGAALAQAHARSGDRIALASYLGQGKVFDHAIADFSVAYANQNERDYERFARAVERGRFEVQTGI